ncbi:hypothetical protein [Marinicrinis lubricantis]|uniref:Spore germination protein GerPC n=1 Tax=Marinicrinis lubricantis TaxID=2086470 RepID=A0ABW1IQD4_9BACL
MPLFRFFERKEKLQQELSDQVKQLETKLNQLEQEFNRLEKTKCEERPTVHVEHVQVDQLIVEKLELNNTFGQLGIKELSGKLNIGATTYGKWPPADEATGDDSALDHDAGKSSSKHAKSDQKGGPKVHMRAKK